MFVYWRVKGCDWWVFFFTHEILGNNVLLVKKIGAGIYHHRNLLFLGVNLQPPLFSSTNPWEFGTSPGFSERHRRVSQISTSPLPPSPGQASPGHRSSTRHGMFGLNSRYPEGTLEIAGSWMVIPLKMIIIGFDPHVC